MTKAQHRHRVRTAPMGEAGLAACREVLTHGYRKVNEVMIDAYTASAIVQVADHLRLPARQVFISMPVAKAAEVAYRAIRRAA